MADESNPEGETAADGTTGDAKPKKKFSIAALKKLPITAILVGLQITTVLASSAIILKGLYNPKKPNLSTAAITERTIASVRDVAEDVQMLNLDEFIVNVKGSHSLKATIQIEVSNPKALGLLTQRMPAVKQRVLNILSQTYPQGLGALHAKLRLKEALRDSLNQELIELNYKEGIVRDVYFVDLIIL